MRALGIVPARAGSKRLVDKNIREIGGKPLVTWAMEAALGAASLDRVVVSSDDSRVLAMAAERDPRLPLPRPAELASDEAMAIDFVRHALDAMHKQGESPFDIVAIVQATSPFTMAADIEATVALLARSEAASAVSVVPVDHAVHPLKMKLMGEDGRLEPYLEDERGRMAAHQLPEVFVRNGSVYVSRTTTVADGSIIGDPCLAYVMPRDRSIDINDEVDLAFAEFMWARMQT